MACFQRFNSAKGFTLIEVLVVLGILGLLAASALVAVSTLRGGSDLQAEARGLQRVLELAKSKTVASEGDTRYGVYATSTSPHRYILFQGNNYASRVVAEDEVYNLRDTIEFATPASFAGLSGQEVVFDRIQGSTSNTGNVVLQMKADSNNSSTVSVGSSGNVEIDESPALIDDCVSAGGDRVCDSRHVHIWYGDRVIDPSETITLNFESGLVVETFTISDFMSGPQLVWEKDDIIVGGEPQKLKIHTHQFNGGVPNTTIFSVHRASDPIHTKPLLVTISGDLPFPNKLIEYNASGTIITGGESIYVASTTPQ
ncbi:MAG TPA: prepilin-type N-terminal cleavage/methylation domain-containing protein [Candidatus Paceibacterota bacterium]